MGRKACLAIGISDAPPLDYLPGAANGAEAIGAWAKAAGYETRILTDADAPVDVATVAAALEALLPKAKKTERLLIYFAGHGLARDAAEDLWLLSQWFDDQRAIAVGGLRRRLERYSVGQMTIVSDACRSLAVDEDSADLSSDNVLGRGPFDRNLPLVDMLKASSRYRAAYMIPGETSDDDRCIFTGVLEEALWGHKAGAFHPDRQVDGFRCITSGSLAKYLRTEVPLKAQDYQVELRPDIVAGFESPDDVYLAQPPAAMPPLRPWPAAGPAGAMGPQPSSLAGGLRGWSTKPERGGPAVLARKFGWKTSGRGRPRQLASVESLSVSQLVGDESARIATMRADRAAHTESLAAAYALEERPTHYETGFGFSLTGAEAKRVALGKRAEARDDRDRRWWQVRVRDGFQLDAPEPLLVELDDGRWIGAAAIPEFVATFTIEEMGAVSLIYRWMQMPNAAGPTERAVAALRSGGMNAESAIDLAVELRQWKHADPVLGVIAAYLYDAQGDVDSVRQIAFFYAQRGQPIPFDVALLARIDSQIMAGRQIASIPRVAARAPRTEAERAHGWTHDETHEIEGTIAGAFPLLRQGWSLLDESDPPLVPKGLSGLIPHLSPAPFTTLDSVGGRQLCELIFGSVE